MSMYQYAVQTGATLIAEEITGSSAAETQAYNRAYASTTNKLNAREQRHTISLNISAIEQDKVLTNTSINIKRAQTKAQAVIEAAASGSEGGSIDAVIYESDKAAAQAKRNNVEQANQEVESLFGQMSSLNESQFNLPEETDPFTTGLLNFIGSVDDTDLDRWGLSLDE